jgi:hypothetical protein
MVAPGSTPPLESWMFPRMLAVVEPWPNTGAVESNSVHSAVAIHPAMAIERFARPQNMALL